MIYIRKNIKQSWYKIRKKKKYIAVFLLKDQESYTIVKKKKFKPSNSKEIRFKGKLYIIRNLIPSFSKGLKNYYCINIEVASGHLLFKKNKDSQITPKLLDTIIKGKIVHQLTSNLTDTAMKMNIMMIAIGGIIGGLIGWIAGGM